MPLSSNQILEAIAFSDYQGLNRGKIHYLAATANKEDQAAVRRFLADLLEQPEGAPKQVYSNPLRKARTPTREEPLGASDLAWLQRLPADPAKVSDSDVAALMGMAKVTKFGTGDRRLVNSILEPIASYHVVEEAKVTRANLQRTPPKVPTSAAAAVAALIARETPELTQSEALQRASVAIKEAVAGRDAQIARSLELAEKQMQLRAPAAA